MTDKPTLVSIESKRQSPDNSHRDHIISYLNELIKRVEDGEIDYIVAYTESLANPEAVSLENAGIMSNPYMTHYVLSRTIPEWFEMSYLTEYYDE